LQKLRFIKNIKYLNLFKLLNIIRLYWIYISRSSQRLSHPSFLSFEPTNYCNLKCPACPSGNGALTRPHGFADLGLFKKTIDENKKYLTNLILHFQGEPMLHQKLGEMIGYARKNKIFTELSTNANLLPSTFNSLKNSMPDKIIISLDGLNQETYNKYRINGDLNKVLEALQLLSKMPNKSRPFVELQFLVFAHNENQISELKNIKRKYKINKISLKSIQIYDNDQIGLLPKDEKYSRYIVEGKTFGLKSLLKNKCKRIIFGSVVTWDGKLVPCCFDKNSDFMMGDVNDMSIFEIRNSKKYNEFVKTVFSHRKNISMCMNCTEGLKND
jgi:radical SAM protein with 4Fe4S-binding SPASM domain